MKTLGIYNTNDPKKPGSKYGRYIFDIESEKICVVDISQLSHKEF